MQAIIFDMDGVLVDSMRYHAEAWDVALKTVGISIDKKIIYELAVVSGSNRSTVHETLNAFFPDTFQVFQLPLKEYLLTFHYV